MRVCVWEGELHRNPSNEDEAKKKKNFCKECKNFKTTTTKEKNQPKTVLVQNQIASSRGR